MDFSFGPVYDRGLAEGWDALSPQEHAVLLYRGIGETALKNERKSRGADPEGYCNDETLTNTRTR